MKASRRVERTAIEREYPERTGRDPHVFVVDAADGAGPMVAPGTGD